MEDSVAVPDEITKEEALAALRAAAWTQPARDEDAECGHPGCVNHPGPGRLRIHSILGGIGADHDLTTAEHYVDQAESVRWSPSFSGHDLVVSMPDGRVYWYHAQLSRHGGGARWVSS